jgi:hypothetical protein
MIWAVILQTRAPDDFGAAHEKGIYGFLQLPVAGDRIQILNDRGLIDLLKVLYIQHTPLSKITGRDVYRESMVHLICEEMSKDVPLPPR